MPTFRFIKKSEYQALDATAKAKYDADVTAFKLAVGTPEVNFTIREIGVNKSNPLFMNIITKTTPDNPFRNGIIPVATKLVQNWADKQKMPLAALELLINQGGTTITGTVQVHNAGDEYEDNKGLIKKYEAPSMRLDQPAFVVGGTYAKTLQIAIGNMNAANVFKVATAAMSADDEDVAYGG